MKPEPQQVFQQFLQSQGLKLTRQREKILDYLLSAKKHVTPEDIYRDMNKKDPELGRSTVFRTLHLLEDGGFADKIHLANGQQAFEHKFARPHHDHMICIQCSNVIEFSNPVIERLQDKIARKCRFDILWHRHEIFGKCKKCRTRKR